MLVQRTMMLRGMVQTAQYYFLNLIQVLWQDLELIAQSHIR